MEHGRIHQHKYEKRILPQAAIHIREQQHGRSPATRTLAVNSAEFGSLLPAWSTLDAGKGTYSALYPYGRIDYTDPVPSTSVSTTFWSPIVAGNDESSSQPVAYFDVEAVEQDEEDDERVDHVHLPERASPRGQHGAEHTQQGAQCPHWLHQPRHRGSPPQDHRDHAGRRQPHQHRRRAEQ